MNMKKTFLLIIGIFVIVPHFSDAQRLRNRWKAMRGELNIGIGASNFLGELGGANQVGTHFFKDFEFSQTRPAFQIGYRYKLSKAIAVNPHFTYGKVAGDDKLTEEFFRNYRNLSFESPIYELNTNFEFAFIKEQVGHRYRLRGVKGQRGYEMMAYGFVGVGVFHFNPKAKITENGQSYNLHDLSTEGQGLVETRKKYSRTQFCIPVGFGFKYTISRRWGIGIEYGIRKTFTDYIDDASRTYFDKNILLQQVGYESYVLSDRSNGVYPYITAPGAQRGDPRYTDTYMFGVVTINYKIRTGRQSYPLF
jgi:hypothetical protein